MFVVAFRYAKRNFGSGLFHCAVHGQRDSPFKFPDVVGVIVEAAAIARAKILLYDRELVCDGIQNAGVLLSSLHAFFRIGSVSEQSFESDARIDLRRKRSSRVGPRDRIGIGAAITPVAIAEIGGVFHSELN